MTLEEAFNKSLLKLRKKHISDPVLEVRLLFSYALKTNPDKFYLIDSLKILNKVELKTIKYLIKKRIKNSSVSSLTKSRHFYDMQFYVDENVLIPRPETELLIDIVLKKFDKNSSMDVLDVGTGSGIIALILAEHFVNFKIDAMDISRNALKAASENINNNDFAKERIKLIEADFIDYSTEKKYDIIISNPPYIPAKEAKKLIKNRILSDPILALNGGRDGMIFYRLLYNFIQSNLKKNGYLIIEHGIDQKEKF